MDRTFLAVGASGMIGGRVLEMMREQGEWRVLGASRQARGPGWVKFDLLDPGTFDDAFRGVDAVMLVSRPGDEEAHVHAEGAIESMRRMGVSRLVVLSALGADRSPEFSLRKVELLAERSGISWTHVRPNFFMQMLAAPPLSSEIAARGTLSLPVGDAKVAYVDGQDVAAVLVRALVDPSLEGRAIDVSGPDGLDHAEILARISMALGRRVEFADIDDATAHRLFAERGFAREHADRVMRFYALVRQGWCAAPDARVAELLGRPLRTIGQFIEENLRAWMPAAGPQGP